MRVGVTGHRWNRINPEVEGARLAEVLRLAMAELPGADGPATLVTGMAEGTDLTAAMARPAHWELEAVLALPEPDWRTHLSTAPGVRSEDLAAYARLIQNASIVLPGSGLNGPDYIALAAHLASSCTCLLALWDGEAGQPGGTSDVVTRALDLGVPVMNLWPRIAALRQMT